MPEGQGYNEAENKAVLKRAHHRLDDLANRAQQDRAWGWARVAVRFRDGQAQRKIDWKLEGTDYEDENSDNVD